MYIKKSCEGPKFSTTHIHRAKNKHNNRNWFDIQLVIKEMLYHYVAPFKIGSLQNAPTRLTKKNQPDWRKFQTSKEIIFALYMKTWNFGLSWLWFFYSFFRYVDAISCWLTLFPMIKIKASFQKFKFSYKERKWWWNFWGRLGGLKSYLIYLR
jgi:hypothetical protein